VHFEVLDGYLGDEKQQYVIRSAAERGRRYMATKMFTKWLGTSMCKQAPRPRFAG
jgi:hypothetical protein